MFAYILADEEELVESRSEVVNGRFKRGDFACCFKCNVGVLPIPKGGVCKKKKGNKSTICGNGYVCVCTDDPSQCG